VQVARFKNLHGYNVMKNDNTEVSLLETFDIQELEDRVEFGICGGGSGGGGGGPGGECAPLDVDCEAR